VVTAAITVIWIDRRWSGAGVEALARVEVVEPTNNAAARALRPAVPWRMGSFGSDSAADSWFGSRS